MLQIKLALKKALLENLQADLNLIINNFLIDYKNVGHATTKVAPAELMFNRKLKTRFRGRWSIFTHFLHYTV